MARLSAQFALPGAASYQADQQILRQYGNGGPEPDLKVMATALGAGILRAAAPAMPGE